METKRYILSPKVEGGSCRRTEGEGQNQQPRAAQVQGLGKLGEFWGVGL